MKKRIGKGWYHSQDEYHPDHDKSYERYILPLSTFRDLNCKTGVYKVVFDALSAFVRGDKRLYWNNWSIKTHRGSPFHIMRSRVSIANDPRTEWRLIVDLRPTDEGGVVDVLIVSPVRDYEEINARIQALLKGESQ